MRDSKNKVAKELLLFGFPVCRVDGIRHVTIYYPLIVELLHGGSNESGFVTGHTLN